MRYEIISANREAMIGVSRCAVRNEMGNEITRFYSWADRSLERNRSIVQCLSRLRFTREEVNA